MNHELLNFVQSRLSSRYFDRFMYSYDSGRKIRPKMMEKVCEKFGKDFNNIRNAAAAVEIIHSASLVHDDIIDGDKERRNKTSFHEEFGLREGVLCGDLFATLGFEMIAEKYPKKVQLEFIKTLRSLIEGQLLEVTGIPDTDTYFDYIKKKTASLFHLCVQIPSIVFGLNNKNLLNYGSEFGVAFQIANDLKRKVTEKYNILSFMTRKEAEKLLADKVIYLNSLNIIPVEVLGF